MQYELSWCKLIYTLNKLATNHRVIVNRCVMVLSKSLATYHEGGMNRIHFLLENKLVDMEDPLEMEKRIEHSDHLWREKQSNIQNYRYHHEHRKDAESDLIYEGWLWKRSSNVIRDWKKRFFQLVNGQLVYYRNTHRELVAGIHLCTVKETPRTTGRESAPPRNRFEVISNKKALVIMATSEEEKENWIQAIRNAIEIGLGNVKIAMGGTTTTPQSTNKSGGGNLAPNLLLSSPELISSTNTSPNVSDIIHSPSTNSLEAAMVDFQTDSANHRCFECKAPIQLNWVSINLGIFICISCSGIHRSLGTHISKVRSLSLDKLTPSQLDILKRLGNSRAKKIWESLPTTDEERRGMGLNQFIREKYLNRTFIKGEESSLDLGVFETVLMEDNLKAIAMFVSRLRSPYFVHNRSTALHIAASEPAVSECVYEFLLLNGSELNAMDETGKTPNDIANDKLSNNALAVFRLWAANTHMKGIITDDV